MKKLLPSLALSLWLLPLAAAAQDADPAISRADPKRGAELAQRWCASCHVVSKDQPQASDATRSFAAIAQSPDFNADRLAFFLLDPHPVMPNMMLSRQETRDLAAYIATLK